MRVEEIEIKKINIAENSRSISKDTKMAELMESIKQHGLHQPIGVGARKDGLYQFLWGFRRIEAFKKLGHKTIPANILDEKETADMLIFNLSENIQRSDLSLEETGRICYTLKTTSNMSDSEIASKLSINVHRVSAALHSYKKIPFKFRDRVKFMKAGEPRRGDISATTAHRILTLKKNSGLTNHEVKMIFQEAKKDDVSASDVSIISHLMKQGLTAKQAMKETKKYKIIRLTIVVSEEELLKRMKNHEASVANLMFKVIYGESPPFKKPSFMGEKAIY